ncbi:MAG: transcriptional regulator [Bacteroidota bacterium]
MKNLSFIFLILINFTFHSFSNNLDSLLHRLTELKEDTVKVNLLNKIGNMLRDSSSENAISYLNRSINLAEKLRYPRGLAIAHFYTGQVHNLNGQRDKALDEYTKSLEILKNSNEMEMIANLKYEIGNIYMFWDKDYTAIEHFLDALKIYKKIYDIDHISSIYLNLGNAYRGINDENRALEYYKLAKINAEKQKDTILLVYCLNNIGNVYSAMGYNEKALEYYELTLETNKNIGDAQGLSAALSNIGSIHIQLGNYKKALEYLNKSQKIAIENNFTEFIIENYKESSLAYEGMGIYKKSLDLHKEYTHISDSVYNSEKHRQIAEMQAKYESEKYKKEKELLENHEKINRIRLYAFGVGFTLFIIIGILIYSKQKSKIKKDHELMEKNKLIHEAQRKLVEVEQKEKMRLQEELKNKNNELTNFALHIIHKNDFIQDIKQELKNFKQKEGADKVKLLNDLMVKLNQNLKTNKELQEFQLHVEKVNHDFFFKLKEKFPDLTENEKRLSALLRLNLSSKEIASLHNISVKAVEMGRYRLRKRIGMSASDNLSRFLHDL